jgi:hypothetical protein
VRFFDKIGGLMEGHPELFNLKNIVDVNGALMGLRPLYYQHFIDGLIPIVSINTTN